MAKHHEVETFHENHHAAVAFGIQWDPWMHKFPWKELMGEIGETQQIVILEPVFFFFEKNWKHEHDVFGMMFLE